MPVELPDKAEQVPPIYLDLLSRGKIEEAGQLAGAAVTKWSTDPIALELALRGALLLGEFDRAADFGRQMEEQATAAGNEEALLAAKLALIDVLLPQNKSEAAENIVRSLPQKSASDPRVKLCRAVILQYQWRLDESAAITRECYTALPEDPGIRLQMGWVQEHAGEYTAALETYASINTPDAMALSCETLTLMGEWDEALSRLDKLLIQYPFNFSILMLAGTVQLRRHNYEEVVRLADKMVTFCGIGTLPLQLKAAALIRLRRTDEARQVIEEGLRRFPLSSGLLVYRGWVSFASLDLDAAREDFAAVAQRAPNDPTSHTGLGAVAFQRRDYQEALDLFSTVSRFGRVDAGARANLALTLAALDRDKDAVPHYEEALRRDPQNIQALACKSGVLFRSGDRIKAKMIAEEALACDPLDSSCRVTLAAIDCALGDYEAARTLLGKVVQDSPLLAQAYIELGILERKQGDNAKARVYLQRALEMDDQVAAIYQELGQLELADGRLDQGESILRDGIDHVKPAEASLYAWLGHIMRLIGEKTHSRECYEDAATQLAIALRTGSDDGFFAAFELGVVQLRLGAYTQAQETFAGILKTDPNEPHAKVMLTRVNVLAAEPRSVRWWSLAIAALAVAQSAAAWIAFLSHQLSATTFATLISLFTGLFLAAALFPKLTKVTLGGLKAELATVNYQPDTPAIAGPSPRPHMTTSAMVGSASWFWP